MTFLTPLAALAALASVLPLTAWAVGQRHAVAVGRTLGLSPPRPRQAVRAWTAAAAIVVLGLAAAQPALTHNPSARVRTNAAAIFVFDTSRSMAASTTPTGRTRLDRAVAAAQRLRAAIADVPAGVATLTDRVLPDLIPVADVASFDAVAGRGVGIESPPPAGTDIRATTYSALGDIASGGYFPAKTTTRLVVLLTDGESNPVDTTEIARALSPARGYRFIAIRFWRSDEMVYKSTGKPETAYRPDPLGRVVLGDVASALGGRAFEEGSVAAAASYLRESAGSGPTTAAPAATPTRTPLAPYLALLSLLLLALSLVPRQEVRGVLQSVVR
jgi:hypothetical protein